MKGKMNMINKNFLCEKIKSIYPDIGECGIDIDVGYDATKQSTIVTLCKGAKTVRHYLPDAVSPSNEHDYGYGAGIALRVIAPTVRHSLCADFAWGLDKDWMDYKRRLYDRRMQEYNDNHRSKKPWPPPWMPEIHLYIDMYY